ncbi:MAG TPA: gluconate 2-dehydrogenase subunit 3 family protein [Steroidobacteraceae bacterium]|nr:gluconate 2-dehydrogenase subunit 3 family protein [Steroidobacteraceae bacterium]
MPERFPGYDVLAKRHTPSWNAQTQRVIDARLAVPREPRFLSVEEFAILEAIAARITPQPAHRPPIPVAALVDAKLYGNHRDGYRAADMPPEREAWRRGLRALDAEARAAHGAGFVELPARLQEELLGKLQAGALQDAAWGGIPPKTFFTQRLLADVVSAYWSHPTAWSEMGFGGPAAPRGYVRLDYDERDPWEAAEAYPGEEASARRANRRVG